MAITHIAEALEDCRTLKRWFWRASGHLGQYQQCTQNMTNCLFQGPKWFCGKNILSVVIYPGPHQTYCSSTGSTSEQQWPLGLVMTKEFKFLIYQPCWPLLHTSSHVTLLWVKETTWLCNQHFLSIFTLTMHTKAAYAPKCWQKSTCW
jgi:hypothetical protein